VRLHSVAGRICALLLLNLQVTRDSDAGSPPLDRVFASSATVILVRVLKSTYTGNFNSNLRDDAAATLVVERYWKGRFSVGDTIQAVTRIPCFGFDCRPYPFQAGQKALILSLEVNNPVHTTQCAVIDGERVKDTMQALDGLLRKTAGPTLGAPVIREALCAASTEHYCVLAYRTAVAVRSSSLLWLRFSAYV
jgi:hypothetical protein